MILIGDGQLGPEIWPKTLDQAKDTEDMIKRV